MENWLAEIRTKLANRPIETIEPPEGVRRAGVVAPLYVKEKELWVLFTKRSDKLETHRGQVSFPGGVQDESDVNLVETALRETEEEIGLSREKIVPLGPLSPIVTVTNYYVEPQVAAIPYPFALAPNASEIDEIWEIPVAALMAPTAVEERRLPNREKPVLFYHYGSKTVWGATAQILSELLEVLAGEPS